VTSSVHSRRTPFPESRIGNRAAGPVHRVPSSRFLTAPTACSLSRFAGLLHPAADPGVRCVSVRVPPEDESGRRRLSPQRAHPSKETPRPQPRRVAATDAVLPFLPGFPGSGSAALLRVRVRSASAPLPEPCALSFLGFLPLQGPPRAGGTMDRPFTARPPVDESSGGNSVLHPVFSRTGDGPPRGGCLRGGAREAVPARGGFRVVSWMREKRLVQGVFCSRPGWGSCGGGVLRESFLWPSFGGPVSVPPESRSC
jgi:hypothetical protein